MPIGTKFGSSKNPFSGVAQDILESKGPSSNLFFQVLDILGRPANAVAGGVDALLFDSGKIGQQVSEGLLGEKVFRFSNILKKAGVGKGGTGINLPLIGEVTARGTAGFALDVLTDPLTYVGLSSLTRAGAAAKSGSFKLKKQVAGLVDNFQNAATAKERAIILRRQKSVRDGFTKSLNEVQPVTFGRSNALENTGMRQVFLDTSKFQKSTLGASGRSRSLGDLDEFLSGASDTVRTPAGRVVNDSILFDPTDLEKVQILEKEGVKRLGVYLPGEQADDAIKRFGFDVAEDGTIPLGRDGKVFETRGLDPETGRIIQRAEPTINRDLEQIELSKAETFARKEFKADHLPELATRFKTVKKNLIDKDLSDAYGAARILDEATAFNSNKLDILRNLEDAAPNTLGATRAAQAQKGQRSLLTFGGKPVIESLGIPLGMSREALRQADVLAFRGIDSALNKIGNWPVFRDVKRAFTFKTGHAQLDDILSKFSSERQGAAFQTMRESFELVGEQMNLLKLDPRTQKEVFDEVVDLLEKGDVNNILDPTRKASSPMVERFVLRIRRDLDANHKELSAIADKTGLDIGYLNGYFPRELTPEVKELFQSAFEGSQKPEALGAFLTASKQRSGTFREMSTTQINQLFESNNLAFRHLQDFAEKNPKWLKKLEGAQPGMSAFFITDPALAVSARLAAGRQAVVKARQVGDFLDLFARRVTSISEPRNASEVFMVPTGVLNKLPKGDVSNANILSEFRKVLGKSDLTADQARDLLNVYKRLDVEALTKKGFRSGREETIGQAQRLFSELPHTDVHTFRLLEEAGVPFYAVDKKLKQLMDEVWSAGNDPATFNEALKWWDGAQTLWKRFTTQPFPAFWTRNFISDVGWQNRLAGINPVKEFGLENGAYTSAMKFLKQTHLRKGPKFLADERDALAGAGFSIKAVNGETLDVGDLWQEYIERGGLSSSFGNVELRPNTPLSKINNSIADQFAEGSDKVRNALNPLKPSFFPVDVPSRMGEFANQVSRFGHFIAKRKAGLRADESIMSVKKFLFDYSELTNFERKVMKRVFPFYTWMRKNIPLQLEAMLKQPGKFANLQKAMNALEDDEVKSKIPEGGIPDFVKREFGIVTRQPDANTVEFALLGSFVPAADLVRIGSITDLERLAGTSLTPFLQAPLEASNTINKNFFTGRPIEAFPGEEGKFLGAATSKRSINALRKIRGLALIDKFFFPEDKNDPLRKKRFRVGEKFLEVGVGIKGIQVDPEKVAQSRILASGKIAAQIKKAANRAKKLDDPELQEYMRSLLEEANANAKSR